MPQEKHSGAGQRDAAEQAVLSTAAIDQIKQHRESTAGGAAWKTLVLWEGIITHSPSSPPNSSAPHSLAKSSPASRSPEEPVDVRFSFARTAIRGWKSTRDLDEEMGRKGSRRWMPARRALTLASSTSRLL